MPSPSQKANKVSFLAGGGEMGALMRAMDWTASPLGVPEHWPQSLRTVIRILLDSRYSMWMAWGPELTFFYNDAYARHTLGKKHPWALGRCVREVWAEIWPEIGPRVEGVLASGQAMWESGLLLFLERNGFPEETYHTFSYSPLYDDNGNSGGMLCVVMEETQRVIAERRVALLRDLAAAFTTVKTQQDVFGAVERCVEADGRDLPFTLAYFFDPDGGPSLVSCAGVAVARADAARQAVWSSFPLPRDPWLVEELPASLRHLPGGRWPKAPEKALVLPIAQQGQERPAGFFVAGLNPHRPLDEGYRDFIKLFVGQIASALASAHAFEEECRRSNTLRELDRAKTVFFSNVSHEFRTPLALMLGPLDDVLSQGALPPTARTELKTVQRNGRRLLKLVNTLLDFSRIEAGRMQATFEPCDLAAQTRELASVFRSAMEKAGIRLIIDCPALPEPVYLDRAMWEKIVLNLLSNAFKFTLEGSITVSLRRLQEGVELSITDTGCGIPPEEVPRLFERFHRVEGTKGRTHEGTGIGLALVQELVKLHGGSVEAESQHGRGSIFRVRLRAGSAHLPPDRISAGATAAMAGGADSFVEEAQRWVPEAQEAAVSGGETMPAAEMGHPRRIIIADDNLDMRQYLARLLAARGFAVEIAADGEAALAAMRRQRPDLVLTDVMMPRLDGFQLLRAIRADTSLAGIPVIMLSARAGEEATVEGMQAGADDYLVKPFSARELMAKLEGRLALVQARRQFEMLLSDAPLGAYLVDADFRIRQVNRAAMAVFGGVPNVIGRDFEEVVHNIWPRAHAEEVVGLFRRTLDTGEPHTVAEHIGERHDTGDTECYEWEIHRVPMLEGGYGLVCYFRDISRHVLARQALVDAERQLRLVTDHAPVMIAHCDKEGRYKFVNKPYAERFGLTPADLVGKTKRQMLDTETYALVEPHVRSALAGSPAQFEHEFKFPTGSMFLHGAYAPERDASGKVVGFVAALSNVSERKRAEQALQQSRAQVEIVVKGANVGVWYCPLPFDQLNWDDKVKEHFHLPPDAPVTIDVFYARLHPEDRERTRATIDASIAQHLPYDIEYRTVSPDGNAVKWIRASGRGFYDDAGNPTRFDGITIDITPQKNAEERERRAAGEALAAAQMNAKFRTFFEQGSHFAGVMAPDGTLIEANRLFLETCGFARDEVIGSKFWECGWWSPSAELVAMVREGTRLAATGKVFRRESPYFLADGSQRVVDLTIAPVLDDGGTVLFIAPTGIDITDRTRLAEERERLLDAEREARGEAERASRLKEDFLTTLSHELRTPLNAILGWTQILEAGNRDQETLDEGLAVIARNARAQTQLIEDLLDMSRITSGKLRLEVQRVDLSEVISAAIESVRPSADSKEIRLEKILDSRRAIVSGDPHRLQQVVWNLLSNALKFTPKGGRIKVVLTRDNSHVELSVVDNGQGIAPDFLPHVFERFRQADASTRRAYGGLGLGLAIVKQLVELHGGTVLASSTGEGKGATFTIALPLAASHMDPAAREPGGANSGQKDAQPAETDKECFSRISLDGVKVLVLDDEPDARNLIKRILDACRATVITVGTVPEALTAFTRHRPDVIVSDIGMPGQDGYEFMRMVRSHGREEGGQTPAAALTAYARPQDRRQALMAGFQSHVVKPADPAELVTVVASLAGKLDHAPQRKTPA